MSILRFVKPSAREAEIELPPSKSMMNRALILAAQHGALPDLRVASMPADIRYLYHALLSDDAVLDIHHAGTAMRFLTALMAVTTEKEVILKGSERMHQRPIGALVDALRNLGADIEYLEESGCPPLLIRPTKVGGATSIRGDVSSQFISALLLSAPSMSDGLLLDISGKQVSRSYIDLSIAQMEAAGLQVEARPSRIHIPAQPVPEISLEVERDWSAAAFFYGWVALGVVDSLSLPGLQRDSRQGDRACQDLFKPLGVDSMWSEQGLELRRRSEVADQFEADLEDCPDLAQALVFTCAALGIECRLRGLSTLPGKETDRLAAMDECLRKVGIQAELSADSIYFQSNGLQPSSRSLVLQSYEDHRMVMSQSLWSPCLGAIDIAHPEVVKKSFPGYWREVEKLGGMLQRDE